MHADQHSELDGTDQHDKIAPVEIDIPIEAPAPAPHVPAARAMTDGPFEVGGRYLVEDLLGGGETAIVFGARHLLLGKSVAMKILRTELAADHDHAQRFLKAARAASQLSHENIISITDFGHDDAAGLTFFVMDRCNGVTLDHELVLPMPVGRALPILLQIARAMVAAHAAGVVHRDIKPKNIFLVSSSGRDDIVKVCDFGLSKLGPERVTATGTLLGAPPYHTPPPAVTEATPDFRVDLYGFGATAYEVLTGRSPIRVDGKAPPYPSEIVPDSDLPPELEEIIIRCLSANPADRPMGAVEIEAVLAGLIDHVRKPTPSSASMIGQIVGTHKLTRLLGSGGIGWVYQAEHPLIGTKVAIKILRSEIANDPTMIDRFVLEARSSSAIGSPHIPRFLDFGYLPNGQPYAVMEYLDGVTLASRLRDFGFLSLEEAQTVLRQVATAMSAAHAQGIIHRDIKPDNLFLVRDAADQEVVKVLDFGIAKLMSATGSAVKTHAGIVLGTAYYCAPEQAMGLDVGPTADIYALGATAYEMLTGQRPFEGQVSAILGAKTTQDAPSLHKLRSDLPDAVERTVARMLERDPDKRMASMTELLAELETWTQPPAPTMLEFAGPSTTILDDETSATVPAPSRKRTTAQTRTPSFLSSHLGVSLIAALAIAAVVITGLVIGSTGSTAPPAAKLDRKSETKPVRLEPKAKPAAPEPKPAPAAAPAPVQVAPAPATAPEPAPTPAPVIEQPAPAPAPAAPVAAPAPTPAKKAPAAKSNDDGRPRGPTPPPAGSSKPNEGVIFDPFKD